jgi:hypothetical protein
MKKIYKMCPKCDRITLHRVGERLGRGATKGKKGKHKSIDKCYACGTNFAARK